MAWNESGEPIVRYDFSDPWAVETGDVEATALHAGQSVGLVREMLPGAEIVARLVEEAEARSAPPEASWTSGVRARGTSNGCETGRPVRGEATRSIRPRRARRRGGARASTARTTRWDTPGARSEGTGGRGATHRHRPRRGQGVRPRSHRSLSDGGATSVATSGCTHLVLLRRIERVGAARHEDWRGPAAGSTARARHAPWGGLCRTLLGEPALYRRSLGVPLLHFLHVLASVPLPEADRLRREPEALSGFPFRYMTAASFG